MRPLQSVLSVKRQPRGVRPLHLVEHGTNHAYGEGCRCDPCVEQRRAYETQRLTDPQVVFARKEYWTQSAYGLSSRDVDDMIARQGGRCAICCRVLEPHRGKGTRTHIDHDHRTGRKPRRGVKVRGILCDRCNKGIGFFADDPPRLERAAQYARVGGFANLFDAGLGEGLV